MTEKQILIRRSNLKRAKVGTSQIDTIIEKLIEAKESINNNNEGELIDALVEKINNKIIKCDEIKTNIISLNNSIDRELKDLAEELKKLKESEKLE